MEFSSRDQRVTYGAVGATRDPDLLRFPPEGFRPVEASARIGHGAERFEHATTLALTWGIQQRSGFGVRRESPEGMTFAPDGAPLLVAGETATIVTRVIGERGLRSPVRVVYVVEEPNVRGFACGTLPGHQVEGEEAFIIEHRDDGSVWLTVRAFSKPAGRLWRALAPVLRVSQWLIRRRYLRALAGPLGT
jgi:uncharacterized protein (UPF0548 family)